MLSVAREDNHLSSIENREDTPREEGKVYNMKKFPEAPHSVNHYQHLITLYSLHVPGEADLDNALLVLP